MKHKWMMGLGALVLGTFSFLGCSHTQESECNNPNCPVHNGGGSYVDPGYQGGGYQEPTLAPMSEQPGSVQGSGGK